MRSPLAALLLLTLLSLPPAASRAQPPTITLATDAPAAVAPGQQFHATLVITSTEAITVGVTLDRALTFAGAASPRILPEPERAIFALPAGSSTITLTVAPQDDARPGPAALLAYSLDPVIRVERHVVVAWRGFLPAVRR